MKRHKRKLSLSFYTVGPQIEIYAVNIVFFVNGPYIFCRQR